MKYIGKGDEPASLRAWRLKQKSSPQNLVYKAIPGAELAELRGALLAEQGYLCGYSMLRIASIEGGHIEHIVAQSKSRGTEWSIRYNNMVYCHPGNDAPRCEFGAHKKDGRKLNPGDFVSTLDSNCETRFSFERDGSLFAACPTDEIAERTIEILNLNCNALQEARKAAIESLPIYSLQRRVSARQAQALALKLLERDADGKFRAFAVALSQIAARYAKRQAAKEAARGVR